MLVADPSVPHVRLRNATTMLDMSADAGMVRARFIGLKRGVAFSVSLARLRRAVEALERENQQAELVRVPAPPGPGVARGGEA